MTDITAKIAEGRRLEQAATAGPWTQNDGEPWHKTHIYCVPAEIWLESCVAVALEPTNAAIIARMRNEYAALLDVLEAAQQTCGYGTREGNPVVPRFAMHDLQEAIAAYARAGGAK